MKVVRRIICILLLLSLLLSPAASAASARETQWEMPKEALLAALWEADISSLREALELGLITCVELTAYYLERIEVYNGTYNCFITLCDDALEQAAEKDEALAQGAAQGSLFGIPLVIKDNMDYAGYYTTSGHSKSSSPIAGSNAQVVEYLLAEGAIILGKTNMSTDAQSARVSTSVAVGQTMNAYNPYLASGGSSGGSAAAVCLNFATAGLGTDTNSSLRYPAVLNGCISLRVTQGTLSMKGIDMLDYYRDVPGAITRTVQDQAILLDVLSGGATEYAKNLNGEVLAGLRIGVLRELSYPISSYRSEALFDDEIEAAFARALAELEDCGAQIVEVSIPKIFSLSDNTLLDGSAYRKENLYRAVEEAMAESNVSALVFPTYLHTPQHSGRDQEGTYWDVYSQTYINNSSILSPSAALPEIAIPIGYHSLGAGIGMEIAALKNQEQLLLDIAYAYTSRYSHRQAPLNAGDLYAESDQGSLYELIAEYQRYEEEKLLAPEETEVQETSQPETQEETQETTQAAESEVSPPRGGGREGESKRASVESYEESSAPWGPCPCFPGLSLREQEKDQCREKVKIQAPLRLNTGAGLHIRSKSFNIAHSLVQLLTLPGQNWP